MNREILKKIGQEYKTPAYVFDLDMLRERIVLIEECLAGRAELCFAMKANSFLVGCPDTGIRKYEVCSPGEFHICERAKIPPEQIVLSGVYKAVEDVRHTLGVCGDRAVYTVESRAHLELLECCAKDRNLVLNVLIRVTSGNQFGVDEEEVCEMIRCREQCPHIHFRGLQYYSGTQKKKLSKIEKELQYLDGLIGKLEEEYQYHTEELEYGPGFYVPYFDGDEEVEDKTILSEFVELLGQMNFQGKVTLEMGRYIAAYCGYYVTSIVDRKINKGQHYAIIDGGIHHLSYFGQMMAMKIPHYQHIPAREQEDIIVDIQDAAEWNVCGSLCTVNDVIVKKLPMANVQIGDVIVFERVGAYSVTEGIYLFLSRRLPKVLTYDEENGVTVLRQEVASDVINDGSLKNF